MLSSVAVVGAGLAGLSAARALRSAGFEGQIVVIGDEMYPPYDRPPLSKDFLAGKQQVSDLALGLPTDEDLVLEWRLGARATALNALPSGGYRIDLDAGEPVTAEGVVIATGARARVLPGCDLDGVHTLRTLDDAISFRDDLVPGARLVVVGGGFIGAEIAATATGLGVKVTLVEAASTALAGPLGETLGALFAALHTDRGVEVLTGTAVAELMAENYQVCGVRLVDGRELSSDVVLVGIGSVPNTDWLAGSGVAGAGPGGDLSAGVLTDAMGATNLPGVVATGDVAAAWDPYAERVVRREHWTAALQHPAQAVATLLGLPAPVLSAAAAVPYFWSDQYGLTLQFAGHREAGDVADVVEGDLAEHKFTVVYRRGERPVAVLAMGMPKVFGQWRRRLADHAPADRA
jgi:3-phenylpropionate/trans-cinnamate dioxygenase ferredoxin reductase component